LLSYAARTGKPQLVVAMGMEYVNALAATDLANLFATFCRYSGAGKGSPLTPAEDALRQVTAALVYCLGVDAVRNAKATNGLTIEETVQRMDPYVQDRAKNVVLRAAGFPI
jgi:hypothetical protein